MSYILVLGIILVVIPLLVIEGFAHVIFFGFMQDDDDTAKLLKLAMGIMAFGGVLIAIHFLTGLVN